MILFNLRSDYLHYCSVQNEKPILLSVFDFQDPSLRLLVPLMLLVALLSHFRPSDYSAISGRKFLKYDWNACGTSKIVILLSMICRIRERDKKKKQHTSVSSAEEEFDLDVENRILKDE